MKTMIKGLAGTAVLLLMASSAMAAALGPHSTNATNPCRTCHNTAAGTPALRGWAGAGAGPATGWGAKAISNLCYMCHTAGGGGFGGTNQTANAYDNASHQMVIASVPEGPAGVFSSTPTTGSGLPYVGLAQLECTSCHNVHVVTSRPFNQRASIEGLCNQCHPGRVNATAVPARTTTLTGDARTFSTHPTAQPLGDQNRANVKDVAGMAGNMKVAVAAAWSVSDPWALGGHLDAGATGNLTCQTCHAVHGPTQGTPGVANLLAIQNDNTVGGTTPAALCEGCHFGGNAGEQVGSVVVQAGMPAGSYSDHPIDANGNRPFYPTGVALPNTWSIGNLNNDSGATPMYGAAGATKPTCQSCHDTHGGIAGTPLLRGPQDGVGPDMVAFSYDVWCFACHTNAQVVPNNHHSVINNHSIALGDTTNSQLSCGDCHGGTNNATVTDWTAHNGFWTFAVAISTTDSLFCQGCHAPLNPRLFVAGGLKGGQTYTNGGAGNAFPAAHGTLRAAADATGEASHQVNLPRDNNTPPGANFQIAPNFSFAGNEAGRVAEWGPTTTPICESCHNILVNGLGTSVNSAYQGLKQGWRANLLLAPYEDSLPGTNAGETSPSAGEPNTDWYTNNTYVPAGSAGNTNSDFCRACHATTAQLPGAKTQAGSYVHGPGAAHTATPFAFSGGINPTPYGRTTTTLMTTGIPPTGCPEVSMADATGSPNQASYPAQDAIDCDSCHRPHNADADSLSTTGTNRFLMLENNVPGADGSTICAECHNTDVSCNQ